MRECMCVRLRQGLGGRTLMLMQTEQLTRIYTFCVRFDSNHSILPVVLQTNTKRTTKQPPILLLFIVCCNEISCKETESRSEKYAWKPVYFELGPEVAFQSQFFHSFSAEGTVRVCVRLWDRQKERKRNNKRADRGKLHRWQLNRSEEELEEHSRRLYWIEVKCTWTCVQLALLM